MEALLCLYDFVGKMLAQRCVPAEDTMIASWPLRECAGTLSSTPQDVG